MKRIEQNSSEMKLERMRLHLQALYKKRFLLPSEVLPRLSLVLRWAVNGPFNSAHRGISKSWSNLRDSI